MCEHLANAGRIGDDSRKWIELLRNIRELAFDSAGSGPRKPFTDSVLLEVLENIVQLAQRSFPFDLASTTRGAFSCIASMEACLY